MSQQQYLSNLEATEGKAQRKDLLRLLVLNVIILAALVAMYFYNVNNHIISKLLNF